MKNFLISPRVLLPFAIVLGLSAITMRLADMWQMLSSGTVVLQSAQAQAPAASPAQPSATDEAPAQAQRRFSPPQEDISPAEQDVLGQLAGRREQLENRAKDLDAREALLKVAEQRVDQKIKEMEILRRQVQSLVDQAGGAQQAQLDNLVKIYETMKPDEAARIFEALDMPVLLGVIQRMKPARTALVLARMQPEKAKDITMALTKQDQLPQFKD